MNPLNVRKLLIKLGWYQPHTAKRTPKKRKIWSSETELLENRALLSAASCDVADPGASAQVVHAGRRATVQFPSVAGQWNVTSTGRFNGQGTANITQDGNVVTSTINIEGLGQFTTEAKFKRHSPFTLKFKTPRIDIPDFPIDLRLPVELNFPSGNLNPTTFSGKVKAPFVGTVATLSAVKVQPT